MPEDRRYLEKEILKAESKAKSARVQAEVERDKANSYNPETEQSQRAYHQQQAEVLEQRAEEFEGAIPALQSQKAETENRIAELKAQRETIQREALEKVTAIDKELDGLQAGLTI